MRWRVWGLALMLGGAGAWAGSQEAVPVQADRERARVGQALGWAGLALEDLNYKKDLVPDPNVPAAVRAVLADPLRLLDGAQASWNSQVIAAVTDTDGGTNASASVASLEDVVRRFAAGQADLIAWATGRFANVSREEREAAVRSFAVNTLNVGAAPDDVAWWGRASGGEEPLRALLQRQARNECEEGELFLPQLRVGPRAVPAGAERPLDRLAADTARSIRTLVATLRQLIAAHPGVAAFDARDIDTPQGRVRLTGGGVQTNASDAWLVIDLGGDDVHRDAGCANGIAGSPLRLVIDLGGDDRYEGATALGIWGTGVVWDESGNDTYAARKGGLGCGVFGTGLLVDRAGDDRYEGDLFCEGAAVFGQGMLLDVAGNDRYRVGMLGQAYAGPGGEATLYDRVGDDGYEAGGKYADSSRYASQTLSLSQGCSVGERPFAPGGIAVLRDGGGDDRYQCGVYGQGVGYWYGLGALIDEAGDDRYELFHYGQGSGIHLAVGLLCDQGGNDIYLAHEGLAQGGSHDFGVGLCWDWSGNDRYTAGSESQGSGVNNAVGLLLEESGDDTYELGKPETGGQGYGGYSERRGFGSVGVLVDAGGHDTYSTGITNGGSAVRVARGAAWDVPGNAGREVRTQPGSAPSAWEPVSFRSTNFVFPIHSTADIVAEGGDPALARQLEGITAGGKAREEGRAALEKLPLSEFDRLVPWAARAESINRQHIEGYLEAQGPKCLPLLRKYARHRWVELRSLAFYELGKLGEPQDRALLVTGLDHERTRSTCLLALSKLGAGDEAGTVRGFLKAERGADRALALRALAKEGAADAREFIPFLDDPDWNVRREAVLALRKAGASVRGEVRSAARWFGAAGRAWAAFVETDEAL